MRAVPGRVHWRRVHRITPPDLGGAYTSTEWSDSVAHHTDGASNQCDNTSTDVAARSIANVGTHGIRNLRGYAVLPNRLNGVHKCDCSGACMRRAVRF